ncbi:MAG: hypothetical protein EBS76_11975, partial [Actinobacteria bacterium]|nr:hypothetical protein [Actinomycetota bacterium]
MVESSFGTTTGYNFNDIFDSPFSDTIIGSDSAESFKTQFGGYDVVTGGGGVDQFEVRYWTDRAGIRDGDSHWWKELQGIEITDYESGEIIELQSMGFDATNYGTEVTTRYDQARDLTIIGVTNELGNVDQDFVFIRGQFDLDPSSVVYVPEGNGVTPGDSVRLSLTEVGGAIITTTDLAGVAVGDLVEPSASEFDYLDLRSLTGEWWVDAATDGLDGDTVGAGTAISFNAGSYGDYYDFRGFEGYIVSGNTDGSEFTLETADGVDDIVVVDGGSGLRIVLDPAIASTGDVLSFRGTTEGIEMDLSVVDA